MDELRKKAYIFGTIFTLANKLQMLGDEFDKNVTTKQWLFILGVSKFQEPPTLSEVAGLIGYSRQNAKRIASALQKSGFVTMSKDKNDARALRIELTEKCVEHFKNRDEREIEFLETLFTGFDSELIDGFYEGVSKLAQNIRSMTSDERDGIEENEKDNEEEE